MLYYLFHLKELFSPLNVFQYISFRSGGAFLTALLICLIFGPHFIKWIKKARITQIIRSDGPPTHQTKSGTPTMGGLIVLVAMLISTFLWARPDNRFIWLALITTVYLGLIGLIDDYHKWSRKHPKGLTQKQKIMAQLLLALGTVTYLYIYPPNSNFASSLNVPYFKNSYLALGFWYITFSIIVMVGASNAVNLTDGLDGLAGGAIVISALTYGVFAYLAGHAKFSTYLRLIPVPGAGELTVYLASMAGACLGFLWFNSYPAEIFMGDTGSLFLGGSIGTVALCIKQELLLVLVGGIFVAESLSVMAQVISYRLTGKRIFRMSPLHHHFELGGMAESKVTVRFWIVAIVLALLALSSLKLR